MKKFLSIVGAMAMVIAGVIMTGCTTEVEEVKGDQPKAEEKKEEKDKVFKVGDTVKVNGLEITITKASFTSPKQYSNAENGAVLTLEVATKNTGDSAFIDNSEFNLYNTDGNKMKEYFGYDELAISGDVNKGKKLDGKLFYDVKKEDKYELIYKPSFSLDDKEIKFEIIPK